MERIYTPRQLAEGLPPSKPETEIARDVRGVIVAFDSDSKRGLVLLQHRSDDSLGAVVQRFTQGSSGDKRCWIATFGWKALDVALRCRKKKRKKRKGNRGIEQSLIGQVVVCTLVKAPKWKATAIAVDPGGKKYKLKNLWQKRQFDEAHHRRLTAADRQSERISYASNLTVRTNVGRPWQG